MVTQCLPGADEEGASRKGQHGQRRQAHQTPAKAGKTGRLRVVDQHHHHQRNRQRQRGQAALELALVFALVAFGTLALGLAQIDDGFGAVAHGFHRLNQRLGVDVAMDPRGMGGEVDLGALDAGGGGQGLLHAGHAAGAGHALDRQTLRRR